MATSDMDAPEFTMATRLTALRGVFCYARDVCGVATSNPEKILRPKVPQREVECLTKDELAKFLDAIPVHTRSGLRHRALAELLCARACTSQKRSP